MIPVCDLRQQYLDLREEIDAAMQAVAAGGRYILGPEVQALERELAEYCDARYACGVANGTDALHLALRALRIGPGDEVITTPFTFVATTEAIGLVGATPVFVDIDPVSLNLDPAVVAAAITPRTRAILPVHLYGQPCAMDTLVELAARHGLHLVEDCAQAIGATHGGRKVGSFGAAGCFSFFPSKNLGCLGDGGMVVTNDREVYERIEMLRRHGGRVKYHHAELGLNSRLDELQAAVLRVKLRRLDAWTEARRRLAYRYNRRLAPFAAVERPEEQGPRGAVVPCGPSREGNERLRCVYHQYTIQVDHREQVAQHLTARGVGTMVYYPVPLHLQEVHRDLGHREGDFPVAERAAERCLSLPMFPELSDADQDRVIAALAEATWASQSRGARRAA